MKKIIIVLSLICSIGAFAQTNAPVIPPVITSQLPGGISQIASDFGAFLTDAKPYFGTNGNTQIGAGVLYSDKKFGGFADITVISLATNDQVTIGFATAYLDGEWYDASLSLKAGTTWNAPVIGPIYTSVESGPGYNFHAGHVISQNFAMLTKAWTIGKVDFSLFAGAGIISDRAGIADVFGANFNVKF